MKRFFDLTFRPFFLITGLGTALASLYAFWPRWAVETAGKIPFVAEYTIITQHWGIMVGLMGVFMIVSRFFLTSPVPSMRSTSAKTVAESRPIGANRLL